MRTAQRKPITTGSRSEHVISTGSAPISERANSSTAYTYPANCAVIDCDAAVCVGGAKITLVSSFTSSSHTAFCAAQFSSVVPGGHTSHAKRPVVSSSSRPGTVVHVPPAAVTDASVQTGFEHTWRTSPSSRSAFGMQYPRMSTVSNGTKNDGAVSLAFGYVGRRTAWRS